jgi:DNA-binding NtrC family response regulator
MAVARHARQHRPPIPVILMTAYATSETRQDVSRMGGTTYITKQFANADLLEAVRRAGKPPHAQKAKRRLTEPTRVSGSRTPARSPGTRR